MPKIARFYQTGGPESLTLEEVPQQQPGPGEVRLCVQAVGLNRAEALFIRGQYLEQPKLPGRLGYEAAGVVQAVGPSVDSSLIGRKVATIPAFSMNQYGVLGEEAIVPVRVLGEYPDKLSPVEAAAIWMQYMTAYGALVRIGDIRQGDFVIIPAASSSVGIAAIQIARAEGAKSVAATRTSVKRTELEKLGADYVIATDEENLVDRVKEITGGAGARLVFDPVAGPFVEKLAEVTAPEGIIVVYGLLSGQPTPFPLRTALHKCLTIRGYTLFEVVRDDQRLAAGKKYIYDRLQDGRFRPVIAKTFPFEQSVQAYQYLESNQQIGKVVITVS